MKSRKLDLMHLSVVMTIMNIIDLTPQQLRRAASIKEKLDDLSKELRRLFDGAMTNGARSRKKRTMSVAVKK